MSIDARFAVVLDGLKTLVEDRSAVNLVHIRALQILLEARMDAADKALVMQSTEYQRRLDILNNEHARLDKMSQLYVRNDIYAKDSERLYTERHEAMVIAERNRTEMDMAEAAARRQVLFTAITVALAVISLLVSVGLSFVHH